MWKDTCLTTFATKNNSTSFQSFKYLSCWILKIMYILLPCHYCFRKFNFHCGLLCYFISKNTLLKTRMNFEKEVKSQQHLKLLLSDLSPRSYFFTRSFTFSTSVRVIDRVHSYSSYSWSSI
jgi:hypothetical protein